VTTARYDQSVASRNVRVEVTAPNFKKAVVAAVQVSITSITRGRTYHFRQGRIEETVNVEATPSLINPRAPTTGQAVDAQTLRSLPLASPNFLYLYYRFRRHGW